MLTKVKIEGGRVAKNTKGKEYLDLKVVFLSTGEALNVFGWNAEYVAMWNDNLIPETVDLDLDRRDLPDGRVFHDIKDIIVRTQEVPPEVEGFSSGPTREELFGGGGVATQTTEAPPSPAPAPQAPAPQRPQPPARRQSNAPATVNEEAIYEQGLQIMRQPTFLDHARSITPRGLNTDKLIGAAVSAMAANPALLECTRLSLINAVIQSIGLGLEVNTTLGEAYIIPFKERATFIPGYKGLVELMIRSGRVVAVQAFTVHVLDEFDHTIGSVPVHRRPKSGDRGDIIGAWAMVIMSNGTQVADYMDMGEINAIRDNSPGYKQHDSPWKTHYGEMARKTVVRRIAKMMPKSGSIQRALDVEDYEPNDSDVPTWAVVEDDIPEPEAIAPPAGASDTEPQCNCAQPGSCVDFPHCNALPESLYGGPVYSDSGMLVQQTGPTTADVESTTTPGKLYSVDVIEYICICPDAHYRGDRRAQGCKHVKAARDVLGHLIPAAAKEAMAQG